MNTINLYEKFALLNAGGYIKSAELKSLTCALLFLANVSKDMEVRKLCFQFKESANLSNKNPFAFALRLQKLSKEFKYTPIGTGPLSLRLAGTPWLENKERELICSVVREFNSLTDLPSNLAKYQNKLTA